MGVYSKSTCAESVSQPSWEFCRSDRLLGDLLVTYENRAVAQINATTVSWIIKRRSKQCLLSRGRGTLKNTNRGGFVFTDRFFFSNRPCFFSVSAIKLSQMGERFSGLSSLPSSPSPVSSDRKGTTPRSILTQILAFMQSALGAPKQRRKVSVGCSIYLSFFFFFFES